LLDDIGELDLDLQVKLLRVLEAREFSRVGGLGEIRLRARVIAATNLDLKREVDRGRFRADLYFRLNVLRVTLPPLRERRGDIIPLAEAFLREFNARFDKDFETISPAARKLLERHAWPGNVRQLRNVIECIVLLEVGPAILPDALATCLPAVVPAVLPAINDPHLPATAGEPAGLLAVASKASRGNRPDGGERERIALALERTAGNVVRAARLLGLKRGALRYRMDKYGITRETALVV
jgi:DNA-binding NtrC family response regulator